MTASVRPDGIFPVFRLFDLAEEFAKQPIATDCRRNRADSESSKFSFEIKSAIF